MISRRRGEGPRNRKQALKAAYDRHVEEADDEDNEESALIWRWNYAASP
jgi:hypothetical protein